MGSERKFECWIDEVSNDTIYARGKEISENPNKIIDEISFELPIDKVEERKRDIIREGAVFEIYLNGDELSIKFLRSSKISDEDLKKIEVKQELLAKQFKIY